MGGWDCVRFSLAETILIATRRRHNKNIYPGEKFHLEKSGHIFFFFFDSFFPVRILDFFVLLIDIYGHVKYNIISHGQNHFCVIFNS